MEVEMKTMTPEEKKNHMDQVEVDILAAMKKPSLGYLIGLGVAVTMMVVGLFGCVGYMIMNGLGVININHPVGWGVLIADFVFWVGIAHSGTLISAVLLLFRAKFRKYFNRSAEAMTIFAVMTAGLFPLIHMGRVWYCYWLFPYPNQRELWVNFRSPLLWDVFAVSTYFTVSLIFFYVGMIPDLAIVRRRATGIRRKIYGILSLGWSGTQKQWKHYNQLCLFLAAFATPLVVSVHSVVSWDFAMSIVPGWHTTIFAPYFVAGAIFSGTAMVITLVVPMRKILRLHHIITPDHFEKIAKILLFTSLIVSYAYIIEVALAYWSGHQADIEIFQYRMTGDYAVCYWLMVFCNVVFPLTLFVKKLRRNIVFLFILSLFVNVGMWLERFVIVVTSLAHDVHHQSWGLYTPSLIEIGITLGSFGLFFTLFLLFIKTLPIVSITELKEE